MEDLLQYINDQTNEETDNYEDDLETYQKVLRDFPKKLITSD
jgi:hypothetical protein